MTTTNDSIYFLSELRITLDRSEFEKFSTILREHPQSSPVKPAPDLLRVQLKDGDAPPWEAREPHQDELLARMVCHPQDTPGWYVIDLHGEGTYQLQLQTAGHGTPEAWAAEVDQLRRRNLQLAGQ